MDNTGHIKPFSVTRYEASHKAQWDRLVASGKNSTFLFMRDYIDHQSDRFQDHSLMVHDGDALVSVLPANVVDGQTLCSHQGLNYGGFVLQPNASLGDVLNIFRAALMHLESEGIRTLQYKRIPRFYNVLPDDEVDYAVFLLNARLCRRDCSQVVFQADRLPFRNGKKESAEAARKSGLIVGESTDFDTFVAQVLGRRLSEDLSAHQPAHSFGDLKRLAAIFPQHIRLFTATLDQQVQASVITYETDTVAHAQHSATAPEAKDSGALDLLVEWLVTERFAEKRYFDLGNSNSENSRALDHSLLRSNEGFGGRSIAHDFYEIDTDVHENLARVLAPR